MKILSRVPLKVRTALVAFALVVLAVLSLELIARLAIFTADDVLNIGKTEALAHRLAFEFVEYDSVQLYREQESSDEKAYAQYVVWKHRPYTGELLNVDEEGNRVTQFNSADEGALEIWMFGGSALFGIGASDGETIPSHMAKLANQDLGVALRVRNFGQEGYVSTQEVVALMRELQTRKAPDIVIFYDGFNDAISAQRWIDIQGSHFQPYRISERFEKAWMPFLRSSGIFRIAEYLGFNIGLRPAPSTSVPPSVAGEQSAGLWLQNEAIVSALGGLYGFQSMFIFQPTSGFTTADVMRQTIQEAPPNGRPANIYILSDVLENLAEPVFIDSVHITGNGNEMVAKRLIEILRSANCSQSQPPDSTSASPELKAFCQ